jgi:hypothetical protein
MEAGEKHGTWVYKTRSGQWICQHGWVNDTLNGLGKVRFPAPCGW